MNYMEFLRSKITIAPQSGFEPQDIHPALKPHQRDADAGRDVPTLFDFMEERA